MKHKSNMSRFSEWNSLLLEQDASRQADLCRSLAALVASEEIERLVLLLDPRKESVSAALKVLTATARSRPQLLRGERRGEIVRRLEALLDNYPRDLGLSAFYLLRLVDPPKAEQFLINKVATGKLSDQEWFTLIANLCLFSSSSKARDALHEIVKRGGEPSGEAQRRLENLGYITQEKVNALARQWRETRRREPLNRLFEVFISLRGGQPVGPVLEILGPPSERKDLRYFYYTSDGLTLYLEQDPQGNLKAMRIK